MKISKLLCTALAGLVVSTAVSEARMTTSEARAKLHIKVAGEAGTKSQRVQVKGQTDRVLGIDSRVIDSLVNGFSYYNGTQIPFDYEPKTRTLVTVKRGGIENDDLFNRNRAFLRYSTDLGDTWSEPFGPLQDAGEGIQDSLRYPNVAIHAPENATSVADLTFAHSNPFVNGGWGYYGLGFTFGNAPDPFEIAIPPFIIDGEEYQWVPSTCLTLAPDGQTGIVFVHLNPDDELALPIKNNNIGMIRYNYAEDDEPVASVPEIFGTLVFDEPVAIGPTPAEDIRTSTLVKADWHGEDLYVGIMAQHRENGNADWMLPMIAKSSDFGDTWSGWDFLPEEDFSNYLASINGIPPYQDNYAMQTADMQVLGEDHVIFVMNLLELVDESTNDRVLEIEYKSGTWTFRRIGPYTRRFLSFFASQEDFDNNENDGSQMSTELQISVTDDNDETTEEFLIAKWIDLVSVDVQVGGEMQEISSYDVFFAARPIDGSSWGPVVNVTNSAFLERITWIPQVIPSLREIPFLTNQTIMDENSFLRSQEPPYDSLEYTIAQRQVFGKQHVTYAKLDLADELIVNSIGEEQPKASGIAITPNPAAVQTNISFELPNNGVAQVDVFDLFGRKVATLHDGMLPAGPHSLTFNVGDRIGGTYFVQITLDGASVSESFIITR